MLVVSQNLRNYDLEFPPDTVMRINLAWIYDLDELDSFLDKIPNNVLIDVPTGRTKPPNNRYTLEEVKPLIENHANVRYVGISNVETSTHIEDYRNVLGDRVTFMPKIETMRAIGNLDDIFSALSEERIVMLDHDDLFNDVSLRDASSDEFIRLVRKLVAECEANDVTLLRARGVIFSDSL